MLNLSDYLYMVFQVYQKGGFLRSDKLLGTSDCKLVVLEEKTEIHESVSLMDGRKPAGGKIEYKVCEETFAIWSFLPCIVLYFLFRSEFVNRLVKIN